MTAHQLAFLLARFTIGVNFFAHGLVRIPKLTQFAEGLAKGFLETWLPDFLVLPFAYILPFVELIIGFMIIIGSKTRAVLAAGAILIIFLIFGSCIKEDWPTVSGQMIYALFFFILITNLENNVWAVDVKNKNKIDRFRTK